MSSDLGGAFIIEVAFGDGKPAKVYYDFDVSRGEIDLKHVMAEDAVSGLVKDVLGEKQLSDELIAELRQQVFYRHINGG